MKRWRCYLDGVSSVSSRILLEVVHTKDGWSLHHLSAEGATKEHEMTAFMAHHLAVLLQEHILALEAGAGAGAKQGAS